MPLSPSNSWNLRRVFLNQPLDHPLRNQHHISPTAQPRHRVAHPAYPPLHRLATDAATLGRIFQRNGLGVRHLSRPRRLNAVLRLEAANLVSHRANHPRRDALAVEDQRNVGRSHTELPRRTRREAVIKKPALRCPFRVIVCLGKVVCHNECTCTTVNVLVSRLDVKVFSGGKRH